MKTNLGNPTGGMLAISGKEFSCKIGDSLAEIKVLNPHLSEDELQTVFNITREQIIEMSEEKLKQNENYENN